jgi:hypothetical protein
VSDTLTREAAFFQDVMAPLLGQDYIAPVVSAARRLLINYIATLFTKYIRGVAVSTEQ